MDEIPDELQVEGSTWLDRVFVNLLDNAIVHAPANDPTVRVSVEERATYVSVSISDEGPGLPEAQQALLESGEVMVRAFVLWLKSRTAELSSTRHWAEDLTHPLTSS